MASSRRLLPPISVPRRPPQRLRAGAVAVLDLRPEHDVPQGPHRRGGMVDPAAHRARCRSPRQDDRPRRRRARHWRRWRRSISPRPARTTSACSPAATRRGATPACRSTRPRIVRPMPTASIFCSSPTTAMTATPRRRGNISPGKPACSLSSTTQERGVFRVAGA